MASWLDTCCMMLERRLPERLDNLDEDDRTEHPWWKCKKWALHILIRTFERFTEMRQVIRIVMSIVVYFSFRLFRHGAPANLPKGQSSDRVEFANFYLKGFSGR
jgi:hypothetical protein